MACSNDSRIVLCESFDQAAKLSALTSCTIFCVPSRMESLGVVFIEAAYCGKPVVALDLPVLRDLIIQGETGFLVDHSSKKTYLFEATPDISSQLRLLSNIAEKPTDAPDGIFLTHAHIGHYTGLMYLGREAYGAKSIPVYAMPKMTSFLSHNGPWDQLVDLKNISLHLY